MHYAELNTDSYSLSMPVGWEVKRPDDNKTVVLGPKVGPFHAGLIVEQLDASRGDFAGAVARARRLQLALPMYQVLEERDLSKDDFAALYVRAEFYHAQADIMMQTQQIFMRHNDDAFVLTSTLPRTPHGKEVNHIFAHMLNSFRLH